MTQNIDLALENLYARRRRIALTLCIALIGISTLITTLYPDLLSSILPVTRQQDAEVAQKPKEKTVTRKKRRPLPKELQERLITRKKDLLRKRMLNEIRRMKQQVKELELLEEQSMAELNQLRDPRKDLIARLKQLNRLLREKTHTYHNRNNHTAAEALDKAAQQLAKQIEQELQTLAKESPPSPASDKPSNANQLTQLAQKAHQLARKLNQASTSASDTVSKSDARKAASAADEISRGLTQLAKNQSEQSTEGLAQKENNPLGSLDRPLEQLDINDLHDISQDLAEYASDLYTDLQAAKNSKQNDLSFADSLASSRASQYQRNQLNEAPSSSESDKPNKNPMEKFAQYSEKAMNGIQQASRSISRQSRLANPAQRAANLASILAGAGMGQGEGKNEGNGPGGKGGPDDRLRPQSGGTWKQIIEQQRIQLSSQYRLSHNHLRQILPARRFSKKSLRQGWFYIDTWYIIGPWKAPWATQRVDYRVSYPPEHEINLEARYGVGTNGKPLQWRFRQFDSVLMAMDPQWKNSVYYLYTELYFEEPQELILSIAADDAAKVWVNEVPVLEEDALSDWTLNENFNKIRFRKGFNKVLIRLQNGPGECDLSVILCTEDLIKR